MPVRRWDVARTVGAVLSVAQSPIGTAEKNIALGYVRRENGLPGAAIQLNGKNGKIAGLPFAFDIS